MIASFTALNTQNPRGNKICSHLFSIIPGKEFSQGTGDKVENEVTDKPKPILTNEEKKENKSAFLTTTNIIVLRIQIELYIKLT